MGHNMLGRYLEQSIATTASPARAVRWYRRSAEAGDFRGMFSLALVLVERGQTEEALPWLGRARQEGNVSFLRSSLPTLLAGGSLLASVATDYQEELELRCSS
ncbi:hypothetical protein KSS94_22215 [Pseudomonas fakonensis]|uniref:Sel1 repeat family protein n=1 Tax=Pseudomonas fakonensis TaxID=2842355 RepID=A0ABX8N2U3_9PSED|nr:hypothetical protein KSS94_22215 [Pseudomonas fakonensis]